MATSQQMLSSLLDMQTNAQAALPVIPNNGNPNGAYNMPRQAATPEPAQPAGPDLSWLGPSQHMQTFANTLQNMQAGIEKSRQRTNEISQQTPPTVIPPVPQGPVLPQLNSATPAFQDTGVVLPQMG